MRRVVLTALAMLGLALACDASGAEGEACDLSKQNGDCEPGLVCTAPANINSAEPVCCPPSLQPASAAACQSPNPPFEPDPSVDGSFAAGGAPVTTGGTGGSSGSGGSAGTGGSAGSGGGAGGSAGAAGSAGAGSAGMAGAISDAGAD